MGGVIGPGADPTSARFVRSISDAASPWKIAPFWGSAQLRLPKSELDLESFVNVHEMLGIYAVKK